MKIVHVETLISSGSFASSRQWKTDRGKLHRAIKAVDWPEGTGKFTIYPQSGRKRGEGNGVKPIKTECTRRLVQQGWSVESQFDNLCCLLVRFATRRHPKSIRRLCGQTWSGYNRFTVKLFSPRCVATVNRYR